MTKLWTLFYSFIVGPQNAQEKEKKIYIKLTEYISGVGMVILHCQKVVIFPGNAFIVRVYDDEETTLSQV